MSTEFLQLRPHFVERIWGGHKMADVFGYDLPNCKIGECWAISGMQEAESIIINGKYAGASLSTLWNTNRELFGNESSDSFPLLVKIIDASTNLSVQVHPSDSYAAINENGARGKSECWYVLSAEPNAEIIIGHNANDIDELKYMIKNKEWDKLFRRVPIYAGDFIQIEPGYLHAIQEGTMLLEIQEPSDLTYRLYDYDRLQNGKPRQLHTEKCIDVIQVPFQPKTISPIYSQYSHATLTEFIRCPFYTVAKLSVSGNTTVAIDKHFICMSIISGQGIINNHNVKKGDHIILCNEVSNIKADGLFDTIISYV